MAWVVRFHVLALVLSGLASAQDREEGFLDRVDAGVILDLRLGVAPRDPELQMSQLSWLTEVDVGLSSRVDLTAITRVRTDAVDRLEVGAPTQATIAPATRRVILGDRTELELRELYVRVDLGRSRLVLGKQQIVWGQADGLKVLDVVNPQNFREFILEDFEDSRIPLWSVDAEIPIRDATLQLVWLPDRSYHEPATPGSVYELTAPGFAVTAPPGIDVDVRGPERPRRALADSDAGARFSTLWGGWDFTLNYLYHYDDFPAPFAEIELRPEGPLLAVTPGYVRTHLLGSTFGNTFGDVVFRGEVGYFFDRPLVARELVDGEAFRKRDQLRYVVGLDWYRFSDTLVSVQLFQDWLPEHEPVLFVDQLATSVSVLLRRDFLNQTLTPQVIFIHDLDGGSGLVRPRITYDWNDRTTLELGADVFYGDGETLFGQFAERDRVLMRMTWAF